MRTSRTCGVLTSMFSETQLAFATSDSAADSVGCGAPRAESPLPVREAQEAIESARGRLPSKIEGASLAVRGGGSRLAGNHKQRPSTKLFGEITNTG